jgi:ribose-phosphate pyrophosphokinase
MNGNMKIFSGSSNIQLADSICSRLEIPLGKALTSRFSDGEVRIEICENVRGADIFIVQSCAYPLVNDQLMELLIMIDAFKRASASKITAVMPYYPYARQDKKNKPRVPISARTIADLIARVGASRIVTMDLHAAQIQGFFDVPVDNIYASPILFPYIKEHFGQNIVIVSPDGGGVPRARAYAKLLKAGLAMIDKRRSEANQIEEMNIIGEVEGKIAIILDDMIDTAGTLIEAVDSLLKKGAEAVYGCATHGILSGPSIERIEKSRLERLILTNTISPSDKARNCEKILFLPAEKLLSNVIRGIHNEDSLSTLFEIPA